MENKASLQTVTKKPLFEDLCFCREADEADCPITDKKTMWYEFGPEFYHPAAEGKGQCCRTMIKGPEKLVDFTSGLLKHAGVDWNPYQGMVQQDDLTLCYNEVRSVSASSCCTVKDRKNGLGSISFRVAKVALHRGTHSQPGEEDYPVKIGPYAEFDSIVGSDDFDGKEITAENTKDYITKLATQSGFFMHSTSMLRCDESFDELQEAKDQCRLRKEAPQQCCCERSELGKRDAPVAKCMQTGLVNGMCPADHVSGHKDTTSPYYLQCGMSCASIHCPHRFR